MSQYWSRLVHKLEPYVPGEQPKDMRYIKLNTNENPYPPSPSALAVMQAELNDSLRLYPDPNADQLKQAIADYYAVEKANVFVGNGSDEVLAHTFAALLKHDKPLLYPAISYSFYPVYARLFEINDHPIPLNSQFEIELTDYHPENNANGAIIFPNPNAPTGIGLSLNSIETILKNNLGSVVVVDEAYVDFGADTAIPLTKSYNNLLVIQTFSKSRSLAGLRVGFAIGHIELIEALERVKNSFNSYPLGRLAISGATTALQDQSYFQQTCEKITNTRERCRQALLNLGFEVLPSQSNFLFAKPKQQSAEALYLALKAEGILVRYFKSPRIDQWLRITVGTNEEMDVFLEKLTLSLT